MKTNNLHFWNKDIKGNLNTKEVTLQFANMLTKLGLFLLMMFCTSMMCLFHHQILTIFNIMFELSLEGGLEGSLCVYLI